MSGCDSGECCFDISKWFDIVDFAGFDQRSDAPPSDTAFVVTCKERVLAIMQTSGLCAAIVTAPAGRPFPPRIT